MSLYMIDIISLSKNVFLRLKKSHTDEKIKTILKNIVETHECFSHNYKYIPMNDENYQQKLHNYQKKTKKLFNVEINEKQVYSLFNKLTKSNYEKIKNKIVLTLGKNNIDFKLFMNKLLKYTEYSQLYTDLICDIIDDIKDKNIEFYQTLTDTVFDVYVNEYLEKYSSSSQLAFLEDFDYDDYDQFCQYNKNVTKGINMLHTITKLADIIDYDIKMLVNNIYDSHVTSLRSVYASEYSHKHIVVYEIYTHVEYLLKSKVTLSYLQDMDDFLSTSHLIQCDNINNKLKFKIQDILELVQSIKNDVGLVRKK